MLELILRLGREDLPLGPIILPSSLDRDNESMAEPAPLNGMKLRTPRVEEQIADLKDQLDVLRAHEQVSKTAALGEF